MSTAEEGAIRTVLAENGGHTEELVLFEMALESAMRLREMYTLTWDQVDFTQRTIFLEKTKNGDKLSGCGDVHTEQMRYVDSNHIPDHRWQMPVRQGDLEPAQLGRAFLYGLVSMPASNPSRTSFVQYAHLSSVD